MKPKRLTGLEQEIMDRIWEMEGDFSVRDVLEHTYPDGEKAYTTVQTVMNNLCEKGYLNRRKVGPVNLYSIAIRRREILKDETDGFLKRMFGGSSLSLVNYLIGQDKLTADELARLETLLREKTGDPGGDA